MPSRHDVKNVRGKPSRVSRVAADAVAATPNKARAMEVKRMAKVGKLVSRCVGFEEQSPRGLTLVGGLYILQYEMFGQSRDSIGQNGLSQSQNLRGI